MSTEGRDRRDARALQAYLAGAKPIDVHTHYAALQLRWSLRVVTAAAIWRYWRTGQLLDREGALVDQKPGSAADQR